MIDREYIFNSNYHDLNPRYLGKTKAKKEYKIAHRSFKATGMIHYVESGSGILIKNGKKYKISAGDIFVFSIGDTASYVSNENDLWTIVYIGFEGALCADFNNFADIFKDENIFLKDFDKIVSYNGNKAALLASHLLKLHASIVSEKNQSQNYYVKFAKTYIKENYMKDITVEDIAKMLEISRFHLSRTFKQETSMTLQEYLMVKRVDAGRKFIEKGKSVKEAAYLCGFGSVSSFSRAYKKLYSQLPSKRKNEITQNIQVKTIEQIQNEKKLSH